LFQAKIQDELETSAHNFRALVWPVVRDWLGGGELIPVESVAGRDFTRQIDMLAGIDAWHVKPETGIRGLASRIQYGPRAYASFTIRERRRDGQPPGRRGLRTELEKRVHALSYPEEGWLCPAYTIQAYISTRQDGQLLHICMARTRDLLDCYWHGIEGIDWERRVNPMDGTSFIVIWWPTMQQHGVPVWHWAEQGVLEGYAHRA
jgi:hypothetical protein